MELGGRIKAARIEAGLSQRQLCGAYITRNMLSQIENGSAHPSMKTLRYLAQQLGKPVSFFLEGQTVALPAAQMLDEARSALAIGDLEVLRRALDKVEESDSVFCEERQLLEYLWHLRRAEQALQSGMIPYGVKLLYTALEMEGLYVTAELRQHCRVLLGMAGEDIAPDDGDGILLVRARQCRDPERRLEILAAAQDRSQPQWILLQAQALFDAKRYEEAAAFYGQASPSREVFEKLEICYRELGDYKKAYEYACKQR